MAEAYPVERTALLSESFNEFGAQYVHTSVNQISSHTSGIMISNPHLYGRH